MKYHAPNALVRMHFLTKSAVRQIIKPNKNYICHKKNGVAVPAEKTLTADSPTL